MTKAIFWDLLGTLGGDSQSLITHNFNFYEEALLALKLATENNYLNIIVTNQSHIAHGRMTLTEYEKAMEKLVNFLSVQEIKLTAVYTCPHTRKDNCNCKKPKTKFINDAIEAYQLDPDQSYIIGDSGKNDMILAYNSGIKSVLVLTEEGIESLTDERHTWTVTRPTIIAENSLDAIQKVLESINK